MRTIVFIVGTFFSVPLILNAAFSFIDRDRSELSWVRLQAALLAVISTAIGLEIFR